MYKGKFDQKHRSSSADVQELLAQRNSAPAEQPPKRAPKAQPEDMPKRETAAPREPRKEPVPPQSGKEAAAPQRPQKQMPRQDARPQSAQRPQQRPVQSQAVAKKKGPRLGGVIFYTLYFLFILVFFIATFVGLLWLRGWLKDYEAAQPTVKAQQVFDQLFTDPNWADLYQASGAQDSTYENVDVFAAYMEEKVGATPLTYLETSAGLSGDKKYYVRLGNENVASFTLVDKNSVGDTTLENLGELPDWQLGAVEVYFQRTGRYLIEAMDGHTVYVNGIALDETHVIQVATTVAMEYLPEGTTGASMCLLEVTGLIAQPEITVFDSQGVQMEVTYDEATKTFTERTESNTMSQEQQDAVIGAAQANCLWMIAANNDRANLAKYYEASSEPYSTITSISKDQLWMQSNNGYEFTDVSVTDFALYSGDIFSARISLKVSVTRTDGSVRDFPYARSMFFRKNDSGRWLCFQATNVDISQPVGKVRLTFMNGETQLTTSLYSTDSDTIITPIISPVPEGKVFAGWVTIDTDENGQTVYTLVFQPDETGHVAIAEGTSLAPMTLYAYFEDAGADVPAETAPQATEGA